MCGHQPRQGLRAWNTEESLLPITSAWFGCSVSSLDLPQSHRTLTCVTAHESISSPELENCAIPRRICYMGCSSWVFQHQLGGSTQLQGLGMLQRIFCADSGASSVPAQSELLRALKPSEQPWSKRFDPEERPGCTSGTLEANLSQSRLPNSTEAPPGTCNPSGCATAQLQALPHFPSLQHGDFWVIPAPCRDRP